MLHCHRSPLKSLQDDQNSFRFCSDPLQISQCTVTQARHYHHHFAATPPQHPIGELCEISVAILERMDSYVEGSEPLRPSRCPRHNRGLSALWLGSKWVTLLDITQLLHNDPTVLLLLQHTRWLTMKVMARQIWTVCLCLRVVKKNT